jgi:hypothetical protein
MRIRSLPKLDNILSSIYYKYNNISACSYGIWESYNRENFRLFCNIDISDDYTHIECPIILKSELGALVTECNAKIVEFKHDNVSKRIKDIIITDDIFEAITPENLIKTALYAPNGLNFVKIKMNKNNKTYYAGNGIITDNNLNVLLFLTINIVYNKEIEKFCVSGATCYINKNIFLDLKDGFNNKIVTKVIPYYVKNKVSICIDILTYSNIIQEIKM